MFTNEKGEQVLTGITNGGPVFVYVKDGKILRMEPLQLSDDDAKSWTIDARGKKFSPPRTARVSPYVLADRSRTYGTNRNLYPMKRVDWDPDGERNPQNRGISGYERISWDEALDIVAKEITRNYRLYGPGAILAKAPAHHNMGLIGYRLSSYIRFLDLLPGYTYVDHNPDSWEGWYWGAMHTWGYAWRLGCPEQYDLLEDALKNTEMIVQWSSDPDATSGIYNGQETVPWRFWLKDLGIKQVFIDAFYNYTAATHCDKWLAPRPGTDTAVACAIAYVWLTEGTYDKEYIAKHAYGFDKWVDYVLGKDPGLDSFPKTPEWAEKESGVPAREIRALAREWASKKTMLTGGGLGGWGGACRMAYATEWARMMVYLAAMQGLGKPGSNIWGTTQGAPYNAKFIFPGYAEGGISGDTLNTGAGFRFISRGLMEHPVQSTVNTPAGQHVPRLQAPECVMNPPQEWVGKGFGAPRPESQFKKYKFPEDGYTGVKMMWCYASSKIATMPDAHRWIRMYRSDKLETIIGQAIYLEGDTKFSDIILPACSNFERTDIHEWAVCSGFIPDTSYGCNHRIVVYGQKCIETLGESKADYDIFAAIAKRMGMEMYMKFTEGGKTLLDWVKRMFEVTDISKYITWEEFEKKGYFVVPMPEDYKPTPALRWFAENRHRDTPDWGPVGGEIESFPDQPTGLATQSGKIEYEAQSLKRFDPGDWERPPVAHHIDSWEGHHTRELFNKYQLQLLSPHPRYSFHTMYDGKGTFMNEVPEHRIKKDGYYYWIIRINPLDAEKRGIKDGDLVKAYNDRGEVILAAMVTERMRPGTVHSYESSAEYDPIGVPGESADRGGTINLLTPSRLVSKYARGMAPNSCLIEIEKYTA